MTGDVPAAAAAAADSGDAVELVSLSASDKHTITAGIVDE